MKRRTPLLKVAKELNAIIEEHLDQLAPAERDHRHEIAMKNVSKHGTGKKGERAMELDFNEWVADLKEIARTKYEFTEAGILRTDWESYRQYYEDGYTPEDALAEDFSNA